MSEPKIQEPSMEEILASIRRIISEEGGAPGGEARGASVSAEKENILELTDVVQDDGSVAKIDKPPPNEPEPAGPEGGGDLLSEQAATTAGGSLAELATLIAREHSRRDNLSLGATSRTLEDLVRDMLRPLLREWLDENLPGLVERLVREEIEKLVRRSHGR